MIKDGRQWAPTLDGIRDDHVERYRWAGMWLKGQHPEVRVLDVGAGSGYGSFIMARMGLSVLSTDIDQGALDYGAEHYPHERIERLRVDWSTESPPDDVDAIVAFEVLEHFEGAPDFLRRAARTAWRLIGSVPNQRVVPFDPLVNERHVRHYTPNEIRNTLTDAGWTVHAVFGQRAKRGGLAMLTALKPEKDRTLVFTAHS